MPYTLINDAQKESGVRERHVRFKGRKKELMFRNDDNNNSNKQTHTHKVEYDDIKV